MKLKKLFAGVVAVAMMATMAFPAFAATDGLGGRNFKVNNDDTFVFDKAWTTNDAGDSSIVVPSVTLGVTRVSDGQPVSYPQGGNSDRSCFGSKCKYNERQDRRLYR